MKSLRPKGTKSLSPAAKKPSRSTGEAKGNGTRSPSFSKDKRRKRKLAPAAAELRRTQLALRASERRFRRLYNSMTEGFLLIEMVLDQAGKPVSYRALDANPALERLTPLKREDIIGRDAREVLGRVGSRWIDTFGHVALTGQPAHIEDYSELLGGWYSVYCYCPEHGRAALIFTNSTEKKHAQAALAREGDLLAAIIDNIPVLLCIWDPELRSFRFNKHLRDVLGWSEADASEGDFLAKVYPDPEYREKVIRYMQSFAPGWRDLKTTAKSGQSIDCSWANVRLADGRAIGIGVDVRHRKSVEAALRESEVKFKTLVENSPDIISRIDRSHRHVFVNSAVTGVTGLNPKDYIGKTNAELGMPPELCRKWEETVETVLASERPATLEFGFSSPEGLRYFSWLVVPEHGPDGEVRTVLGIARDVTDARRAEAALREVVAKYERQVRLFEGVASTTPDFVYLFDLQGRFLYANRRLLEVWGMTLEDIVGKTCRELGYEQWHHDMHMREMAQVIQTKHPIKGEVPFTAPLTGIFGVYEYIFTPVFGPDGGVEVIAGTTRDVTERKRAEEVLARDKEQLERIVAARTERLQELVQELEHFSYTITHDMRAPLRAMRGMAEILNEADGRWSPEEQKKFVAKIITAAERMDALITDALHYSRMVRQEVPVTPVDPGKLLRGMLETYPEFQSAGARISVQEQFPLVMGNEAGLTQCFSNLLQNAVKFAKPGECPEIRVWAERVPDRSPQGASAGSQSAPRVRLWIEDKGIGISDAMKARVFDMFAHGSIPQAGTGIGLALVRKVADRMGGRVGVESKLGAGSRFWLELKAGDFAGFPNLDAARS